MPHAAEPQSPWEVFFATFEAAVRHLPHVVPLGGRPRPGSPVQRALLEAERRALQTAWKVEGDTYPRAVERAADLVQRTMEWMRVDGRDRAALRNVLRSAGDGDDAAPAPASAPAG